MRYKVRLTRSASYELRRLPGHLRQRARRTVDALAQEPRPHGAKELRGLPGRFRLRIDGWRIIYKVDEDAHIVILLAVRRKVGPETYQGIQDL